MSEQRSQEKRRFTIEQANAMLPLIKAIAADLAGAAKGYVDRRQRFKSLTDGRDLDSGSPYDEELAEVQRELEEEGRLVQGYVDELQELGVELKSMTEGLIDFPSTIDGREVCLCWKLGEAEVLHWHECDAGYAERQSLLMASVADGDEGSGGDILL